MIVLLDTNHDLDEAAKELGCRVEQLLTPLTRFKAKKPDAPFAIDNGAFAGFNRSSFESLLKREAHRPMAFSIRRARRARGFTDPMGFDQCCFYRRQYKMETEFSCSSHHQSGASNR